MVGRTLIVDILHAFGSIASKFVDNVLRQPRAPGSGGEQAAAVMLTQGFGFGRGRAIGDGDPARHELVDVPGSRLRREHIPLTIWKARQRLSQNVCDWKCAGQSVFHFVERDGLSIQIDLVPSQRSGIQRPEARE